MQIRAKRPEEQESKNEQYPGAPASQVEKLAIARAMGNGIKRSEFLK